MTNVCIGLLTLCAFLIGLTIILLFLGEIMGLQAVRLAVVGFLAGVLSFLLALVLFLSETVMATRLLDFHLLRQPPR
jgi:energy-converting hydrogenase Eha subunit A